MNSNSAYRKLLEFAERNEISYQQMREMTLTGTPFRS